MANYPAQQDLRARPSGRDNVGEESTGGSTPTSPTDTSSTPALDHVTAPSAATPISPRQAVPIRSHIHAYMTVDYGAAAPVPLHLTSHTLARLNQEALHGHHSVNSWLEGGSLFSLAAPVNISESLLHDGRTEGAAWTATTTQASNVALSSVPRSQRDYGTNEVRAAGGQFDEVAAAPNQSYIDFDGV